MRETRRERERERASERELVGGGPDRSPMMADRSYFQGYHILGCCSRCLSLSYFVFDVYLLALVRVSVWQMRTPRYTSVNPILIRLRTVECAAAVAVSLSPVRASAVSSGIIYSSGTWTVIYAVIGVLHLLSVLS